ncbi:hypothetical protein MAIT1_04132 [Magnetofaba australis IT-1]|uniref:Helicase-associated domain-containing protein n=1 Tax=Magnetofaba australis IT-1 TaxID=1434232 RepID=A0A1Y2K7B8_9PROT|nr:hypothetical protein MAIT1_04132 [Magnetofaba australis IT-1]
MAHGAFGVQVLFQPERKALTPKMLAGRFDAPLPGGLRPLLISNAPTPNKLGEFAPACGLRAAQFDALTEADFNALRAWILTGAPPPPMRYQPPAALSAAWRAVGESLPPCEQFTLTLPPGACETLLLPTLIEGAGAQSTVLLAAPSVGRLASALEHWSRHASSAAFGCLLFDDQQSPKPASDHPQLRPWELPYPTTGDGEEIAHFTQWRFHGVKVLLAAHSALPALLPLLGASRIDRAIVLEAHKAAGKRGEWLQALRDDELWRPRRTIHLTQSPTLSDIARHDPFGDPKPVYDITEEPERFGPVRPLMEIKDAVAAKLARKPRICVAVLVAPARQPDQDPDQRIRQGLWRAAAHLLKRAAPQRTISYHPAPNQAQAFFSDADGNPQSQRDGFAIHVVQGRWPAAKREESWQAFHRFAPALMAGARAPLKGEPTPPMDAALILPDCRGKLDMRHALGPLMAPHPLDPSPQVVIPLLFHEGFGPDGLPAGEPLGLMELAEMIQSLRGLLPEVDAALREIRLRQGLRPAVSDKPLDCAPLWRVIELTVIAQEDAPIRQRIGKMLMDLLGGEWDRLFGLLAAYRKHSGSWDPPDDWEPAPELAAWVKKQRKAHDNGVLPPERLRALDALGFDWDPAETQWWAHYAQLQAFKTQFGHDETPDEWPQNPDLPAWVRAQRRAGMLDKLPETHRQALDAIDFVWDLKAAYWNASCDQLGRIHAQFGAEEPPISPHQNADLFAWITQQRRDFARGKLNPEQIARLDAIGFIWDPEEHAWQKMFDALARNAALTRATEPDPQRQPQLAQWVDAQRKLHDRDKLAPQRKAQLDLLCLDWDPEETAWQGMFEALAKNAALTRAAEPDPEQQPQLAQWAEEQRKLHNRGKLPEARKQQLDLLCFDWDPEQSAWRAQYAAAQALVNATGALLPDASDPAQAELAQWLDAQRKLFARGKLAEERAAALGALGIIWDAKEAEWRRQFESLRRFQATHQHCHVPTDWAEDPELAKWVAGQRRLHKREALPQEHFDALTAIGFLWDAQAVYWEEMFLQLAEYKLRHGHCNVSEEDPDHGELGWWVEAQRKSHRNGSLGEDRGKRLHAMGFVWDPMQVVWEERFADLERFRARFGHCIVPNNWGEDAELARWVQIQRNAAAKNLLAPANRERLAAIGFEFDPQAAQAEEWFFHLAQFQFRFGHCNVPVNWPENPQLGLWVQFQRQTFAQGRMEPQRAQRLQNMGFNWQDPGA